MIDQKYSTDAFEDAIAATVYMATVHIRHGELTLPERVRTHVADGPVVVHLLRGEGEDDFARIEATLTGASKLTGIEWPDDVTPRMSLTVLCPRGAAGHDIAVLLPPLAEPLHFEYAEDDREAAPVAEVDPLDLVETSEVDVDHDLDDEDVATAGELPDDPWAEAPTWPGDEDVTAQEVTDLLPIVMPEIEEHEPEPGTVYSAVLVAAKTRRRWFSPLVNAVADTIRWSARWEEEHALTLARVVLGGLSLAVLGGVGVLFALGVTR